MVAYTEKARTQAIIEDMRRFITDHGIVRYEEIFALAALISAPTACLTDNEIACAEVEHGWRFRHKVPSTLS